jgi:hypothetical protein
MSRVRYVSSALGDLERKWLGLMKGDVGLGCCCEVVE